MAGKTVGTSNVREPTLYSEDEEESEEHCGCRLSSLLQPVFWPPEEL